MSNQNNTGTGGSQILTQAKIKLAKPNVHARHPFRNPESHEKLLEYLQERLELGKYGRDINMKRYTTIDKAVAGWMRLTEQDKQRQLDNEHKGTQKPTAINLPLAFVHLDDMMTYFATTFSPNRGMFYQTGKPEEQKASTQIVTLMNNHAIYAGYYRETLQTCYSLLKYNVGGFEVNWSKDQGVQVIRDDKGGVTAQTGVQWQGNKIRALDQYNFFYDPLVHPTKLHCDGEFAATVEIKSYYWLQNKASQGLFFNCDEALNNYQSLGSENATYYRSPPREANLESDESGGTDWKGVLTGNELGVSNGFELATIHIKLNPTEFDLIDGPAATKAERSRYECWRFTVLNNEWIVDATYMNNVHGFLPYFLGVLNDDIMGLAQKSTAEILNPLQTFASSLLNTHVQANRKNLWGLTVYDPTMVDLSQIPEGEVSARIPMMPAAYGRDVRTGVWTESQALDTKQTMQDLESVMSIIDRFFPTSSAPSQIASIDRAVDSQVAAVQQGVSRRQQKQARLLDDSLFRNVRFVLYYNIMQYQQDQEEVTDYYSGKQVTLNLAELKQTDLPFIIGQGLKAIDRQAAAKNLQQVIFALIQAPNAAQGIDILKLIDYWSSMIDIDIDMTQFRLAPPQVGPDGQPIPQAADAGTAGGAVGTGILPATAPTKLTAPIYGGAAGLG